MKPIYYNLRHEPDARGQYEIRCEFCGHREFMFHDVDVGPETQAAKRVCPVCRTRSANVPNEKLVGAGPAKRWEVVDETPLFARDALKSVTALRWSLMGAEAERAEDILRELIELVDDVKCAV